MRKPLLIGLSVGSMAAAIAGATVARASSPDAAPPPPVVLSRPRGAADALAPELQGEPPGRSNAPVAGESRRLYQDGNATFWITPSTTGGVCLVTFLRRGPEAMGGANCVSLAELAKGPVLRVHGVAGDVDVALAADGDAANVATRNGGRVLAENLVAVPFSPISD